MTRNRNARRPLYLVSGFGRDRAGKHKWFGAPNTGGYRGWANFVQTQSLRHANAQYRRLTVVERQMDVRYMGKALVLKHGNMK